MPKGIVPNLFTGISWAPDGSRTAFAGGTGEQSGTADGRTDVYIVDADGSSLERVTELRDAVDPLWSPDGETIVFTRIAAGERGGLRGGLWSVRPDGSGLTQLPDVEPWQMDRAGSFSPDGSELAFTRTVIDPESGEFATSIYVAGRDGSDERQLIESASDPSFSTEGDRIAFVSDRDENGKLCYGDRCFFGGELYVANADGGDPERLTETYALNETVPSWLSDDSRTPISAARCSRTRRQCRSSR